MKTDFTDSECPTSGIAVDELPDLARGLQRIFEKYTRPSSYKTLCCTLEISRGRKGKPPLAPEVQIALIFLMELEKFLKEYDNPPDGNRLYRVTALCGMLKKYIAKCAEENPR
jgi:hypothetical protein